MKGAAEIARLITTHPNFQGNSNIVRRGKGGEYRIDGEWMLISGGIVRAVITVNVYAVEA